MRVNLGMSAIFPSGQWELLNMSTHIASCIPVDRGRRYHDRAGRDKDTAALQTKSNVSLPWGRWETLKVSATRTDCNGPKRRPQLCKRESGQARQQFPIGAMGTFEDEREHR